MLQQMHSSFTRVLGHRSRSLICNVDYLLEAEIRKYATAIQPNVIRVPVTMAKKIKEAERKKKVVEKERRLRFSQQGNKSFPLISCKREQFNHYRGQSYTKFQEIPLASKGWSHYKSAGDYFTINSTGSNPAFVPMVDVPSSFKSLGLSKDLLKQLAKSGFQRPTNIQALAIPHLLEGKNTLITAETGNGKTLAFLAPMLQQIARCNLKDPPMNSPYGLIIAPGRELAQQIYDVASPLGEELGVNVELIKGGRTKKLMQYPKVNEVHLVVATVGALSKLITARIYNMGQLRHVVVDEADTMLDDSFSDIVLHIMSKFPIQGSQSEEITQAKVLSGVQLTLVAATMPRNLSTILDPIVNLESLEKISTPYLHRILPHIPQKFVRVNDKTRAEKLLKLVKESQSSGVPVIIFSNESKTCDWVSLYLNENEVPCINMSGGMHCMLREGRFKKFQDGEFIALSCTDLASRGLNTIGAGHVINFQFPKFISDYIHRCGRIGRVGSKCTGLVTNLVQYYKEVELVKKIEYAARKGEEFHNVNANIKRAIMAKRIKQGELI